MKSLLFILAALVPLNCPSTGNRMQFERIGPDKDQMHPTFEQPGWPAGMIEIVKRDSRVYSRWGNGNENYYFEAAPDEIGKLMDTYSKTRLREHVVTIKEGKNEATSFKGLKFGYSVNFHFLGGIALDMMRRKSEAETNDATLTIYVDPAGNLDWLEKLAIPDNIIVNNEVEAVSLKSDLVKPEREFWYAKVNFENKKPAADFENGVSTNVTLWERDTDTGFKLGNVNHEGAFSAAFSEQEIADLKADKTWLTMTVGNSMTKASKDHPRLDIDGMSPELTKAKVVEVAQPHFYFGRLLFEDGTPGYIDPLRWEGAEIMILFPYAGSVNVDKDGYFAVFFTAEQLENAKAKGDRKNIYIPDFNTKGRSKAMHAFPAILLSHDKDQAGEFKIADPRPANDK